MCIRDRSSAKENKKSKAKASESGSKSDSDKDSDKESNGEESEKDSSDKKSSKSSDSEGSDKKSSSKNKGKSSEKGSDDSDKKSSSKESSKSGKKSKSKSKAKLAQKANPPPQKEKHYVLPVLRPNDPYKLKRQRKKEELGLIPRERAIMEAIRDFSKWRDKYEAQRRAKQRAARAPKKLPKVFQPVLQRQFVPTHQCKQLNPKSVCYSNPSKETLNITSFNRFDEMERRRKEFERRAVSRLVAEATYGRARIESVKDVYAARKASELRRALKCVDAVEREAEDKKRELPWICKKHRVLTEFYTDL
eukprot:TRINITY_DN14668_c0_g1_i1.p1 TRINITY_DN14668_c0_g1~~TRINITY_DN14668_c0_g1_i1.p1  ORF type:complete len:306 (-),score=77.36 TRINITY_DN14668_c0_g1_i1:109-1026(-)